MTYMPAPGYQPVYNPPIPFSNPIYGGLQAGMSVYIQGTIPHHINRFHVNFACGSYDGADIAFHFNPRFDGWDKIVFNSFEGGSWCSEEKKHHMPFSKGEHFELVFIINNDFYQVNVNGAPFYEFRHRIPLERVECLQVEGDVSIQSINFIGGGGGFGGNMGGIGGGMMQPSYNPGGMPGGMQGGMNMPGFQPGNLPMMGGPATYNPAVPYRSNILGGMTAKRTVVVRGFIPQGANRFHVNFMVGGSREIALHINPRINENCVVRNSFLNGGWGNEERECSYNPFSAGQYFDISVRCGNYRFKVYVNGQHLFNFDHRYREFQRIDTIEIEGDVVLSYVQF
ncbi:galectin-4 isoform X1 [Ambystoma mexicanum]|uniref:galectin-4 isoform X1 n=1 Tax=Ambystoma mexicanum TaxID=8296 RepID=UPI0037E7CE09